MTTIKKLPPASLSAEEQQGIKDWLRGKHCPSCVAENWSDPEIGWVQFASGFEHTTTGGHPVVKLTCRSCGLLSFFCASVIGIYKPSGQ